MASREELQRYLEEERRKEAQRSVQQPAPTPAIQPPPPPAAKPLPAPRRQFEPTPGGDPDLTKAALWSQFGSTPDEAIEARNLGEGATQRSQEVAAQTGMLGESPEFGRLMNAYGQLMERKPGQVFSNFMKGVVDVHSGPVLLPATLIKAGTEPNALARGGEAFTQVLEGEKEHAVNLFERPLQTIQEEPLEVLQDISALILGPLAWGGKALGASRALRGTKVGKAARAVGRGAEVAKASMVTGVPKVVKGGLRKLAKHDTRAGNWAKMLFRPGSVDTKLGKALGKIGHAGSEARARMEKLLEGLSEEDLAFVERVLEGDLPDNVKVALVHKQTGRDLLPYIRQDEQARVAEKTMVDAELAELEGVFGRHPHSETGPPTASPLVAREYIARTPEGRELLRKEEAKRAQRAAGGAAKDVDVEGATVGQRATAFRRQNRGNVVSFDEWSYLMDKWDSLRKRQEELQSVQDIAEEMMPSAEQAYLRDLPENTEVWRHNMDVHRARGGAAFGAGAKQGRGDLLYRPPDGPSDPGLSTMRQSKMDELAQQDVRQERWDVTPEERAKIRSEVHQEAVGIYNKRHPSREKALDYIANGETDARYLAKDGASAEDIAFAERANKIVAPLRQALDQIGADLTRRGILKEGQYKAHAGKYSPHYYLLKFDEATKEFVRELQEQGKLPAPRTARQAAKAEKRFSGRVARGFALTDDEIGFTAPKRWGEVDLPTRKKLGLQPLQNRVAQYAADTATALKKHEFFDDLAKTYADNKFGKKVKGLRWGNLDGTTVPHHVYSYLQGIDPDVARRGASTMGQRFARWWKRWHTAGSPPTFIRNIVSALVHQNEMAGMSLVPGVNFGLNWKLTAKGIKEFYRGDGDIVRLAQQYNLFDSDFTVEMGQRVARSMRPMAGMQGRVKTWWDVMVGAQDSALRYADDVMKVPRWRETVELMTAGYGGADNMFRAIKFAQNMHFYKMWQESGGNLSAVQRAQIKAALGNNYEKLIAGGPEALAQHARDAYVDYRRHQFAPWENKLKESPFGVPFWSFQSRMGPRALEWMTEHPVKARAFMMMAEWANTYNLMSFGMPPEEAAEVARRSMMSYQSAGSYPWGLDEEGDMEWFDAAPFTTIRSWAQPSPSGELGPSLTGAGLASGPFWQSIAGLASGVDPRSGRPIPRGVPKGQHPGLLQLLTSDAGPNRYDMRDYLQFGLRTWGPSILNQGYRLAEGEGPVDRGYKRDRGVSAGKIIASPFSKTYRDTAFNYAMGRMPKDLRSAVSEINRQYAHQLRSGVSPEEAAATRQRAIEALFQRIEHAQQFAK